MDSSATAATGTAADDHSRFAPPWPRCPRELRLHTRSDDDDGTADDDGIVCVVSVDTFDAFAGLSRRHRRGSIDTGTANKLPPVWYRVLRYRSTVKWLVYLPLRALSVEPVLWRAAACSPDGGRIFW